MIRDNFTFEMELLKNPWTGDKATAKWTGNTSKLWSSAWLFSDD
jgi:hypothetical protein